MATRHDLTATIDVTPALVPGNLDQWYAVGRHLRDCECSTEGGRDIVRRIAEGLGL